MFVWSFLGVFLRGCLFSGRFLWVIFWYVVFGGFCKLFWKVFFFHVCASLGGALRFCFCGVTLGFCLLFCSEGVALCVFHTRQSSTIVSNIKSII